MCSKLKTRVRKLSSCACRKLHAKILSAFCRLSVQGRYVQPACCMRYQACCWFLRKTAALLYTLFYKGVQLLGIRTLTPMKESIDQFNQMYTTQGRRFIFIFIVIGWKAGEKIYLRIKNGYEQHGRHRGI
jgi:hypothetical protein